NVTNANHRVNDVIATEDGPQTLVGRFMYGPLDMVTLTGEKVDILLMTQPQSSRWVHFDTDVTNSSGRITYVPKSKKLGLGVYPIKMVVKGDQTSAEAYLTVLPRGMECVVFSINGSFAASVSIMGSDPKVRPGAVDVVRHWQDLGYLIIYITGRPDMQKQRVVSWLSQHNFPHGMIFFSEGLVHDPLRQKTIFLKNLVQECHIKINSAYGSMKDITVYNMLGLGPSQIYIVGRPSKKYQNQCQEVAEPLQDLKEGMEQLEKNNTLRYILATLLSMGNFLNGTNAKGFELTYLEKVSEVKDTVHKQSLLHHACSVVVENFPQSTDLYSEIGAITRSAKVDFDQLQENLCQMERRCKASWDHLKVIAKHEMKPQLKQKMSDFLKDCAERIIILKIVHRRIINRYLSSSIQQDTTFTSDTD
ncbi:hypothetical protein JOQ06_010014, partial [Pogonophryne albipinna]